jgi:hypothetical protein
MVSEPANPIAITLGPLLGSASGNFAPVRHWGAYWDRRRLSGNLVQLAGGAGSGRPNAVTIIRSIAGCWLRLGSWFLNHFVPMTLEYSICDLIQLHLGI